MCTYPSSIQVFGHDIDIKVFDKPIPVEGQDDGVSEVLAQYDPQTTTISAYHIADKPAVFGSNLIHELIEVSDCHGDLKLNHTQISTLASALYQAFTSGQFDFSSGIVRSPLIDAQIDSVIQ